MRSSSKSDSKSLEEKKAEIKSAFRGKLCEVFLIFKDDEFAQFKARKEKMQEAISQSQSIKLYTWNSISWSESNAIVLSDLDNLSIFNDDGELNQHYEDQKQIKNNNKDVKKGQECIIFDDRVISVFSSYANVSKLSFREKLILEAYLRLAVNEVRLKYQSFMSELFGDGKNIKPEWHSFNKYLNNGLIEDILSELNSLMIPNAVLWNKATQKPFILEHAMGYEIDLRFVDAIKIKPKTIYQTMTGWIPALSFLSPPTLTSITSELNDSHSVSNPVTHAASSTELIPVKNKQTQIFRLSNDINVFLSYGPLNSDLARKKLKHSVDNERSLKDFLDNLRNYQIVNIIAIGDSFPRYHEGNFVPEDFYNYFIGDEKDDVLLPENIAKDYSINSKLQEKYDRLSIYHLNIVDKNLNFTKLIGLYHLPCDRGPLNLSDLELLAIKKINIGNNTLVHCGARTRSAQMVYVLASNYDAYSKKEARNELRTVLTTNRKYAVKQVKEEFLRLAQNNVVISDSVIVQYLSVLENKLENYNTEMRSPTLDKKNEKINRYKMVEKHLRTELARLQQLALTDSANMAEIIAYNQLLLFYRKLSEINIRYEFFYRDLTKILYLSSIIKGVSESFKQFTVPSLGNTKIDFDKPIPFLINKFLANECALHLSNHDKEILFSFLFEIIRSFNNLNVIYDSLDILKKYLNVNFKEHENNNFIKQQSNKCMCYFLVIDANKSQWSNEKSINNLNESDISRVINHMAFYPVIYSLKPELLSRDLTSLNFYSPNKVVNPNDTLTSIKFCVMALQKLDFSRTTITIQGTEIDPLRLKKDLISFFNIIQEIKCLIPETYKYTDKASSYKEIYDYVTAVECILEKVTKFLEKSRSIESSFKKSNF